MHKRNYTPFRRVILQGNGHVERLRFFLPYITDKPLVATHELLNAMVEALRYRDKAMPKIVAMVEALEDNIAPWVACRQEIINTVKDLILDVYYQLEDYNLYDDRGMLMYTYFRHPDEQFDDIILSSIIQLTFNGQFYEPPTT